MQLLEEGGVTKDNRDTKENENPSAIRVLSCTSRNGFCLHEIFISWSFKIYLNISIYLETFFPNNAS